MGFKTTKELAASPDSLGHTMWDYIAGDPENFVPPLDPLMIESSTPRSGSNPFTNTMLAPPSKSPGPGPNPINGHEYTPGTQNGVQVQVDDLQYACIFPLPQPRDCSDPAIVACDCLDPKNDNPLCEPVDPSAPTSPRTKQVRAKAYPGLRQLALVRALGDQGVVGSICPAELDDPSSPAFGYRPAVTSFLDQIGARLATDVDGFCAARSLAVDASGHVACTIVEARNSGQSLDVAACDAFCKTQPGRIPVLAVHAALRTEALADPAAQQIGADCVCEIPQLGGPAGCQNISSELAACQCDPAAAPTFQGKLVSGFCYVDAMSSPPTGNPDVVSRCPDTQKREVRFVGEGSPALGAVTFLSCSP